MYHQTRFIFFAWLVAHLKSLLTCFLSTPGRLAAFSSGASRIHFHSAYILYRHGSRFCGARLLYSPHQSSVLVLFPTVCAWFSYRLRFFNAFGLKRHAYFLLLSQCHTCIGIKMAEPWFLMATKPAYVSFPSPPHHISRTRAFCS